MVILTRTSSLPSSTSPNSTSSRQAHFPSVAVSSSVPAFAPLPACTPPATTDVPKKAPFPTSPTFANVSPALPDSSAASSPWVAAIVSWTAVVVAL